MPIAGSQAIDATWLSDNATTFGGDATKGPWVLGKAFGSHSLPSQDSDGNYAYHLAVDVATDGTAFVNVNKCRLDVNGHALTYSNSAPITGINGEFESDVDGGAPTGWDTSLCDVGSVPTVRTPASHGEIQVLFGNNVLAWEPGTNGLPNAVPVTFSVDGSNNAVLNFSGSAPANGQRISLYITGSFTNVAGNHFRQFLTSPNPAGIYFVVNSSGSTCNISYSPPGTPYYALYADVTASGSGYNIGDLITVSGGTSTSPAIYEVVVTSGVSYLKLLIRDPGSYTVQPSNPVSFAGGSGTGLQANITWNGDTLQASAASGGGNVARAQAIRVTGVSLSRGEGFWYAWKYALGSSYPGGYGKGTAYYMPAAGYVYRDSDGAMIGCTGIGIAAYFPPVAVGTRPFCATNGFKPLNYSTVTLEFVAGSGTTSNTPSVWVDALRLTTAYNWAVLSTNDFALRGADQLPAAMRYGGSSAYSSAKAFTLIDTTGGGSVVQGTAKSYRSNAVYHNSNNALKVLGLDAAHKLAMTVNGDDSSFVLADAYSGGTYTSAARTIQYFDWTYGANVDMTNRQYYYPAISANYYVANILIDNGTVQNIPQIAVNCQGLEPNTIGNATFTVSNCTFAMNSVVANQYCLFFSFGSNITIDTVSVTGSGYGLALYPGNPTPTLKSGFVNCVIRNLTVNTSQKPERESGADQQMRAVKFKTVAPGPWGCYKDILFENCNFTATSNNGYAIICSAFSYDVRNGDNIPGNGNIRFNNCTFKAVVDNAVSAYNSSIPGSYGLEFDQCDPGMFPVFYNCTSDSQLAGIWLAGIDGYACQGAAFVNHTFIYTAVVGYTGGTYYPIRIGTQSLPSTAAWVVDPIYDATVPSGQQRVTWAGTGTFTPYMWAPRLLTGGSGYASLPTVSVSNPPGASVFANSIAGGAVVAVEMTDYGTNSSTLLNTPNPTLTFSGGSPSVAATGEAAMIGSSWPFRYLYNCHALVLTVQDQNGNPLSGATVTITDANSNQVFPRPDGSVNVDSQCLCPTVTDSNGNIGIVSDIGVIPLPINRLTQGDHTNQQTSSAIAGTCSLDGTNQSFTSGTVEAQTLTPLSLTISKTGYTTHTESLTPTGAVTKTVKLSNGSGPGLGIKHIRKELLVAMGT